MAERLNGYQHVSVANHFLEVARMFKTDAENVLLKRSEADKYMKLFVEYCDKAIRSCADAISYAEKREKDYYKRLELKTMSLNCVAKVYEEKMRYHAAEADRRGAELNGLEGEVKRLEYSKNTALFETKKQELTKKKIEKKFEMKRTITCGRKFKNSNDRVDALRKEYVEYLKNEEIRKIEEPRKIACERIPTEGLCKNNGVSHEVGAVGTARFKGI
jgi:hypothetical protein